MYTKQEASKLRQEFWTAFGQYMRPVLNAEGESVNWINYKTGVKDIFFRMDADKNTASVYIEIAVRNDEVRGEYYTKLVALKSLLEAETKEQWLWNASHTDEYGNITSRAGISIQQVNLFNRADWPAIISFLKPRMIALDAFWIIAKDSFS